MPTPQPIRGMQDLLPADMARHRHVVDTARAVAARYGFAEAATPIVEATEIFARTLGDSSDVVSKEMYTFADRGGEGVTLRPEYTAGLCRAVITHGLCNQGPQKFFAHGPMFRYERPQKGRQRQFHQIDVELIGVAEPQADIETVAVGHDILVALGIREKCSLEINTLGDPDSRRAYREALVAYFGARLDKLSEDSRARLRRNPLRILDSKDAGDRAIVAEAPGFDAYLNDASRRFFDQVLAGLATLGIAHKVNRHLVRGLDYYTHSAFEFVTEHLGAQGAVIAGGRYDGLIETMGGPPTPGIGWAGGIERLALLCDTAQAETRPIAIVPIGETAERAALKLAHELRTAGFRIEQGYRGNVKKRMERANKLRAAAALILGDDELAKGAVMLRDLDSGAQEEAPLAGLAERLARYRT